MNINDRIEHLKSELNKAISSELMTYEKTKQITTSGIYLIYNKSEVIYVGKTNRNGKTRLRELASDYRSHTLNRKIFRSLLSTVLKYDFPPLNKETKHRLISGGILSEQAFLKLQAKVNDMIKTELRFRFYSIESDKITELEHFAISVLNPKMND